jgi:Tfp pilus assembly protein PilF
LRRTQLEVLSATAQIALGHHDAARESFERALAADPDFELDARSTSPKIRSVFDTVRREPGSPKP